VGEKRRTDLHRAIGARLEAGHGTQAGAIAAALAVHFAQGHDHARAVHYLRQAADNAVHRHAYAEGLSLLTQALELLHQLPDTPERWRNELDLRLRSSPVLMATKGYAAPDVEATLTRALTLSGQIGDTRYQIRVALALAGFYLFHGDLQQAKRCAEESLELAGQTQRSNARLWSHYLLGMILLMMGELAAAHTHLVEATSLYGRHSPAAATFRGVDDPGVRCHIDAGLVLWCLGYPDQALQQSRHGLSLAEKLAYPLNLASAWHLSGMLHQLRGEPAMARKYAEALLGLSTAQDISPPRAAGGLMLHGWTVAVQGNYEEGLTHIRRGLTQWEAAGSRLLRPYALATLAGVYLQSGQPALGLALVKEALAMVNVTGESWYEAELYRLQGELTLAQFHGPDGEARAEVIWRNALAVARGQEARSWELRVAMSLARLWERQGKRREARDLVAPIYGWFTEGHDTEDLQQAKALLDAMS
jgi:tetratricopeptide (TPR) repeat protein